MRACVRHRQFRQGVVSVNERLLCALHDEEEDEEEEGEEEDEDEGGVGSM